MLKTPGLDTTAALGEWYKSHARVLPWRIGPDDWARGRRADPYRVWISEMMLQQTTVATVKERYDRFLKRFPTVKDLAAATQEDVLEEWAGLGYYSRARNLHKAAQQIADTGFPDNQVDLVALPGIGAYTSAAIASIAFDDPHPVVDGNVERIIARLHCLPDPPAKMKKEVTRLAGELTPVTGAGNHAQAMMDLASSICRPRNPQCLICPIRAWCGAAASGNAEAFPVRLPKKKKPTRSGAVAVGLFEDDWILERRPPEGLLGGTLGWPGGEWREGDPDVLMPAPAEWVKVGTIKHTFTHFHLELDVYCARIEEGRLSDRLVRISREDLNIDGLTTVMKKVFHCAQPFFD